MKKIIKRRNKLRQTVSQFIISRKENNQYNYTKMQFIPLYDIGTVIKHLVLWGIHFEPIIYVEKLCYGSCKSRVQGNLTRMLPCGVLEYENQSGRLYVADMFKKSELILDIKVHEKKNKK